jgi:dTMP kinase
VNVPRGRFITLEGGEGVGKSSQLTLLADALRNAGYTVVTTREPGGTPGAEEIRALLVNGEPGRWDPMSELLLFAAARHEHVRQKIAPALARGEWVLCDRFADSTMAYQGYGHQLGREPCETAHKLAIGNFQPDLTLVLDLPVEAGMRRATSRGNAGNRYEGMAVEFHRRVRDGFLEIARREPARCCVIDASGVPLDVQAAIRRTVAERLGVSL